MKKLILVFVLIIFTLSCESDDNSISESLNQSGKNIYAAGYFVDDYPNGLQYAAYWVNGERFVYGEGEITDIHVENDIVYATGLDENWEAVYWVDGIKTVLDGNDTSSNSIFIHDGNVYVAGRFSNGSSSFSCPGLV